MLQVDLADAKSVHSVITQGGFYDERIQGLYPRAESWVSEYVLSYSNTTTDFQFYRAETGGVAVSGGYRCFYFWSSGMPQRDRLNTERWMIYFMTLSTS